MRVITGKFKGKKLLSPEGDYLRPTSDRVKESIFDILSAKGMLRGGTKALDLFCGSGALGIEALSRGVSEVVFNDSSDKSVSLTRENLKKVGASSNVLSSDFAIAIKRLSGEKFDIIFLDPPYKDNVCVLAVELIVQHNLLNNNGIIIIEQNVEHNLQNLEKSFIMDTRKYGKTKITLLTLPKTDEL